MIWEIYQQTKIADAERNAEKATRRTESYASDLERVRKQMDRLALASQSLWELVREQTDLTEKDLQMKILEVDQRDGKADGKMSVQLMACGACGKSTNSKRVTCVFCGERVQSPHAFDV